MEYKENCYTHEFIHISCIQFYSSWIATAVGTPTELNTFTVAHQSHL